ncbi:MULTISPECIES: PP2C family serine/threonine-protein phosphatase [Klebsiella/Raoultella group]|uniref:PPM-type phosphatase domain-containing protein n=4 Tax=Klebsiella/Raoultella group TaxID=2890311 RepID=A0A6G6ANJ6_KLEPN|nr:MULTISPECIES: PP2C family serine/threonine-protein phosphatase [Klebsiella/Raoultella group]MDM9663262.1 PP2C family serine/threonine-protein phosphatase [Raoultella planticola]KAB8128193.1 protein phosphatase 2C domain-containing protein [Raoultella ornithinolytica]MBC4622068.1 protein phosphatase 2C domain-containing protein [Klebsiella pneumoniae]MBN7912722.1 protein phosphatase 2C domain-containing protein [Klebsiella pneumoniae]MBN8065337.1 protein phosphatase 2C domain-containing prot
MSEFSSLEHKIVSLILEESAGKYDPEVALQLSNDPAICGLINDLRECVINPGPGLTLSDTTVHKEADAVYVSQQESSSIPFNDEQSPTPIQNDANQNDDHDAQMDFVQINPETSRQEMNEPPEHELVDTTNQQSSVQAESAITDVHPALSAAAEAETSSIINSDDTSETVEPAQSEATLLRPGEIPHKKTAEHSPALQKAPDVSVLLANARVGESFDALVDIITDSGVTAEVTDIHFSQDIGLLFCKNEKRLKGTPAFSGNFDMTVKWSCPSHPDNEKKLLFIVNPDPKSLWKVIAPPTDAPFFKESVDHRNISSATVNIVGASRRGRSHEHAGTFRDDDFYINVSDESGWNVLLVADGAGSARFSREGSRIVADTVGNYLFSQLKAEKGHELKDRVLRWNSEDQRAVWDFMNHHFRQAALLAVHNISSAAIMAQDKVKSFSTTLLATVTFREGSELFAASFWLGDGAIAAYGPVGKVRVLGAPDSGEYAGQTRFLDAEAVSDTGFSKRISIGKWNDVSHLVLMTDGVSDPWFETDNGLQNPMKWDTLMTELNPLLSVPDLASSQLVEWLNFFSPGNHDDRTIVVLW